MPSADDRIVRMEFDNAAFEKKINSTLASLTELDKALKFTGAQKGLTDVSDAAKKVSFDAMGSSLEDVSKKFIALSTIAITTLVNITNQAIHAGVQIAKSFTVAPLIDGFREYETQLNSVQTILANTASKGTTLDQVSAALDKLNTYSDQTIYNFGQMAKNIGTFTAAGVDLDTSVLAIKGIANLAALSGSSAEQASGAMYQLSQAIATGTLRLIDWNSVNAAGIGGEVFQNALFETGKALGTLTDVPMTQTFTEWKNAGNSFRDSLQDDWITADVLNTTLAGFTGDLTEEMLIAKGFSQDVATSIVKTAAIAKAAATEVKTFTQLVGTVKEAVGTGWADSFKIIIGNFTQAKALWTGVNNSIGTFVQKNSDARNAILSGWAAFGGRDNLIQSAKEAFENFGAVITPIKEAFQNIFPPLTAQKLLEITDAFGRFVDSMKPGQILIDKIRIIAQGLFSVLSIGWTIVKEGVKFLTDLARSLLRLVTPEASDFLVKLGLGLSDLQGALVKGEGIKKFFDTLTKALQKPIEFLGKVKEAIANVFDGFRRDTADVVEGSVTRLSDRFAGLKNLFDKLGNLWEPLENALRKVVEVLDRIWDYISGWFKELGERLAKVMNKGDFDSFLDALNTALFGGIVLLFKKFVDNGLKIDLGGGLIEKITGTFGQLTETLKSMQLKIKADAILKIAGAVGILTASVLVLSTIDSAALGKALTAMAVGFTQLMASFSVFTKIASTPASAASFTILSVGLGLLSTALLILSGVVKVFSKMSWEEMGKGLAGVAGILGILTAAAYGMGKASGSMIAAGTGIAAMAVGLLILSIPMKVFSKMSWEEIGKGLATVAVFLLAVAGAMQIMPATLPITAAGLIGVAFALTLLIAPMKVFSKMSWEEIGKGLGSIAAALLIIAGAMHIMPITLPITAAGLILVGIALTEIAGAMKLMATMSWEEIGKGLTVMAGALLILSGALYLMSGTILGSLALVVAAEGLLVLSAALKIFGKMSFDTVLDALLKVALALGAFALIALALQPAIGAMLLLGAALVILGVGFALVGAGAYLVAKAFQTFAKAGDAGIEMIKELIGFITESLPKLAKSLAKAVVGMVMVFAKAAPVFAKMIGKLVDNLLDALIPIIPKAGIVIEEMITEIIRIVRAKGPELINTGLFLLTSLLQGISNNIENIVSIVGDILVKFINEFSTQLDRIVEAAANLFRNYFLKVSYEVGKTASTLMVGVGKSFIQGFLDGVEEQAPGLIDWFKALPGNILDWIGDVARTLWQKGWDIIDGLWRGLIDMFQNVISWVTSIPRMIFDAIVGLGNLLKDKGQRVIEGFWEGMKDIWDKVVSWVKRKVEDLVDQFTSLFGIFSPSRVMRKIGRYVIEGFNLGMQDLWADTEKWLNHLDPTEALDSKLADNMTNTMNGVLAAAVENLGNDIDMSPVITPVLDLTKLKESASRIGGYLPGSTTYAQAQTIAKTRIGETDGSMVATTGGDIKFEQTINSPTQLSTSDIYKNTRNQIALAKEELSIP